MVAAFQRIQEIHMRLRTGEDRALVAPQQAISGIKLRVAFKTKDAACNARTAELRKIGLKYEKQKINGVWQERVLPLT